MSVNKIFRTHGGKMAEEMKSWTGFKTDDEIFSFRLYFINSQGKSTPSLHWPQSAM